MSGDGTKRDELYIGQKVEINPKADRSRKELVLGVIADILTSSQNHTHGIMVRLEGGEIGRVKNILSSDENSRTNSLVEPVPKTSASIEEIIKSGENHFAEFKSSMLWSERLTQEGISKSPSKYVKLYGRDASKAIIATTISGFLNADGGDLIIGLKENKSTKEDEVIGIESEYFKLKDPCEDGYRRKILDAVIKPFFPSFIFNHFNKYLSIEFSKVDEKTLCRINVAKSDGKVFINIKNKNGFYVRIDASTRELHGEEIVDYCMKRFV